MTELARGVQSKGKVVANEEIVVHVEDNPAHADLIRRQLTRTRPEVKIVHFADGDAALRSLKSWPTQAAAPKLILLDLRLPKVDGIEVLRQLKAHPELHRLPVVILSTSNAQQDLFDAYRHGANSYLVKPLEFESFREMIAKLCHFWLDWNTDPV